MATLLLIIGFALLLMEALIGTVANGFIVLIGCIDWFRSRKLSSTDLILTWLGLARLAWQAIVILDVTTFSFFLHTSLSNSVVSTIAVLWFFTYNVNLLFATWLSILYFVKITTFSHPLFLQVKQRFSGLVPWLLLGSVAFSAFMTVAIALFTVPSSALSICNPYRLSLNNTNNSVDKRPHFCMKILIAVVAPGFILSVMFLSSTVLLIISLRKHIRHLLHNGISTKDRNISIHLNAIKALASFAILYLFSFVANHVQQVLAWKSKNHSWTSVLLQIMSAVYPSGHAVILIFINPKMKQAWDRMMHHLKCQVSEAPS